MPPGSIRICILCITGGEKQRNFLLNAARDLAAFGRWRIQFNYMLTLKVTGLQIALRCDAVCKAGSPPY
jgi:hypothetical protein